jgi:hypothetical protein
MLSRRQDENHLNSSRMVVSVKILNSVKYLERARGSVIRAFEQLSVRVTICSNFVGLAEAYHFK